MPDYFIMKKSLTLLVLILGLGGWNANKSSEEQAGYIEQASDYSRNDN